MEKDIELLIQEITQKFENNSHLDQSKGNEIIKTIERLFKEVDKCKDKEIFKKFHPFMLKLPEEFYNAHVADLLKLQIKFSDRQIYRSFLEIENLDQFLQHEAEFYDSKNKISLYILIKIMRYCSPKEIILFLNENLNEVHFIEKKFFIIEIYGKILDRLEKKELFLDQIFPMILMYFSSAIQKFIKNKEKLDTNPDLINQKDIIINFEKYVINLIRKIMTLCKNFKELQDPSIQNKIFSINEIFDYSYETGELKPKEINQNHLLKHYLICFVMDIMEGVLDALTTPYFDRKILTAFSEEIMEFLFELNPRKIDYVNCFLSQIRYFALVKQKPVTIKENVKSYDKSYPYNCLAIANILSSIVKDDAAFNMVFSLKYKLKILIPVINENLKVPESKLELFFPLIKELGKYLNNEKEINKYNLFDFENLNIFNAHLSDFVNHLLELSGNFNCNEENRKIMVDICNIITEMPNEKVIFAN